MKKLAIITTHPIQYYAPVFQLLHERSTISIKVFYTWGEESLDKFDPGFDKKIEWDIPLLENYPFEWVTNTSSTPGSHDFKGVVNPYLIDQLLEFSPDALLFIGWAYHGHLKAIRYFKNKLPVYFRGDSTLLDERNNMRSVLRVVWLKWIYKHVDHAFYNGINNKAYFKKYGLKDRQLTFAPHAIDNERFGISDNGASVALRTGLGIDQNDILILFAGKFEEKKDPELLMDAFLQLDQPGVHLLFAGNGALEKSLKQKAESNAAIHFMDFQNQRYMPVLYKACQLFCLPSKGPGESWGLAVNEAMASCKAVLVSDKTGCAPDLVKNGYNGAIFRSGDIDDLKYKLSELLKSGESLKAFGVNSLGLIKDLNFVNIATAIENKLLNEKKRPD